MDSGGEPTGSPLLRCCSFSCSYSTCRFLIQKRNKPEQIRLLLVLSSSGPNCLGTPNLACATLSYGKTFTNGKSEKEENGLQAREHPFSINKTQLQQALLATQPANIFSNLDLIVKTKTTDPKRGQGGTVGLPRRERAVFSFAGGSAPLFFLQVSNDPLQFPTLFPLHGLQDLSWTLWLAHGRLPTQCLAILLDECMLILPRETKKIDSGSHLGGEVSEHTRSKNSDVRTGG